jgi:hypothetical protein
MVEPLRHRQTKGAETDMLDLTPPRHVSTPPTPVVRFAQIAVIPRRRGERVALEQGFRRPFEINEAFAVVARAAMRDLALPHGKSTPTAAPARSATPSAPRSACILVTLFGALRAGGLKHGVAPLCIGGGEATAMAIEAA